MRKPSGIPSAIYLFTLAAIALLGFTSPALACSCLWQGPFKAAIAQADLIAYGEVTKGSGNSIDLKVEEVLKGSEYRSEIRVWGNTGELCRPEAEDFPPGSQWIMALNKITQVPDGGFDPFKPNISYGRVDDYSLSSCAVSWLPVNEQRVSGNIVAATRWQYLDPKKTPVLMDVFMKWFLGEIDDVTLAEAARPQTEARKLLNNTRMFLWQLERESRDAD